MSAAALEVGDGPTVESWFRQHHRSLATREAALVRSGRWHPPAFARGGIWMADGTALTRFDSSSGTITHELPIRSSFAPTPDPGGGLWVIDDSGSLVRIDLDTRQPSHSVDLGLSDAPFGLLATEDHIWVGQRDGPVRIVSTP